MTLDLTDHEASLLMKELNGLIDGDRYFLSDRVKTLKAIRAKIRPEPLREPLPPPPKQYAPPRATVAKTARRTLRDWLCHSLCGRVMMKMMASSEPIAVRLQKI
jgi:hypothetical protein